MASTVTLTCKQCGYVNEAERVYCHNCGTKLDRSILPKEEDLKKKEKPGHARKRIQRMANPGGGAIKREATTLVKTLVYAATAAALLLAAREPANVPPAKGELSMRLVSSELMEAAESPQPRGLAFTETEVNGYLKQAIKSKKGSGMIPGIEYERSFVDFEPGTVRVFSEQSLWGYSLYSSVLYRLEVKNGTFTPTLLGGGFGRLAVHPLLMQYGDYLFHKLWGALKREHEYMKNMREVRLEKDRIVLYTRGGAAR
jgi:hypothetical protein